MSEAKEPWGNLVLVEFDDTEKIFSNPSQKATEDYISGRFG